MPKALAPSFRFPPISRFKLVKNLNRFYRRYILKDEFLIALKNWSRVKGDSTLRLTYPLTSDSIVMDVGGYKGDFAADIYLKYGCTIFVFEPMTEFYLECVQRFAGNPKIRCFNFGLADFNGDVDISDDDNASSILNHSDTGPVKTISVRRYSDVIKELGITEIDLLKLNIEGAEFAVLRNLIENGLVSQVRNFQIQFHNFFPNAETLRNDIRATLTNTHQEDWNFPFVWESWSRHM